MNNIANNMLRLRIEQRKSVKELNISVSNRWFLWPNINVIIIISRLDR